MPIHRPITAQSIAKQMKPFGIRPAVKKVGGTATRVYLRGDIEAAAARYVSQGRNPVTSQEDQKVSVISRRNLSSGVTPQEHDKPLISKDGYEVAHQSSCDADTEGYNEDFDPDMWA